MNLEKPDPTEDVIELLAWKKATRIMYNYKPNALNSLVRTLVEELNIRQSTARGFMQVYSQHKDEIVHLLATDPFRNDRGTYVDNVG